MTKHTPTTEHFRREYATIDGRVSEGATELFDRWLNEIRAEAWDAAWREIRMIPHWWNTEDQYGEFDLQPLGPDETSEQGAFMAVREVMLDNPYRTSEK